MPQQSKQDSQQACKSTPGPWQVDRSTDSFGWVNYAINQGKSYGEQEDSANTRLIKHGPEMLRALQRAMAYFDNPDVEPQETEDLNADQVFAEIENAIRAAVGAQEENTQ